MCAKVIIDRVRNKMKGTSYMSRKQYANMDPHVTVHSLMDFVRWQIESRQKNKDVSFQLDLHKNVDVDFLCSNLTRSTITWIGHSTFLIQMAGLNIVTDPVWAKLLGTYRRLSCPGIPIHELPPIDVVLISHSHYDHLNYRSIRHLKGQPLFLVPSGLDRAFKRRGYERVIALEWWGTYGLDELTFSFAPAQHWTKRTLTDTNRSHWGGWVVEDGSHTIYFVGDSGYFKGFQQIGDRFDIDYCLMPIGAYEPEWLMATEHVSPEEAIQAFIDTHSNVMIPMHYGAYMLADDTTEEALDRLKKGWAKTNLGKNRLNILQLGETLCF